MAPRIGPGNPLRRRRRRWRRFRVERRPAPSRFPQRATESGAGAGLRLQEPVRAPGSRAFPKNVGFRQTRHCQRKPELNWKSNI
ncbi:Ubiquitin Carboxyl-Terminal Hydrolase 40 [Manis pentadactyla]|nr:Ubiquitin Carboxyl-Terminal Hydrolase 40 [Manis pentadactyla]